MREKTGTGLQVRQGRVPVIFITLHGKTLLNRIEQCLAACPRCSHLSTILNNIVEPESGVTILFNICCVGVMYSGE
jgi:hypothetical protein